MPAREPRRPGNVSPVALACLEALSASGLGHHVLLGGAFGLAHYFEYRPTQDVDAWWDPDAMAAERQRVVTALETALHRFGEVHTRTWGDVVSVELSQSGRKVFSFQIAGRAGTLSEPVASPWAGVRLDSLDDLIASKMTALIDRGAPRDFRDLYTLCTQGVASIARCWELWERRQRLSTEDPDRRRAALAIHTHLARIMQSRPLSGIADFTERQTAERLRKWFGTEFLSDLD